MKILEKMNLTSSAEINFNKNGTHLDILKIDAHKLHQAIIQHVFHLHGKATLKDYKRCLIQRNPKIIFYGANVAKHNWLIIKKVILHNLLFLKRLTLSCMQVL